MSDFKSKYLLISILLISLVIRLIVPLFSIIYANSDAFLAPDSYSYLNTAKALYYNGSFTRNGYPELLRTPGYPFFLLLGIWLKNIIFTTIILQILLSTISVYLIYKISFIIFEKREVSIICALYAMIDPLAITYTSLLLTETLYSFLLLLFILSFCIYLKKNDLTSLILAAFMIAFATYVRPVSYFLPILICMYLVVAKSYSNGVTTLLYQAVIFLIISFGIMFLWQVRNIKVANYNGFAAVSDYNIYFYQGAATLAKKEGISIKEKRKEMGKDNIDKILKGRTEDKSNQGEIYKNLRKKGMKIIRDNPLIYLYIHLRSLPNILLSHGALDFLTLYQVSPNTRSLGDIYREKGLSIFSFIQKFLAEEKPIVILLTIIFELYIILILFFACMAFLKPNIFSNKFVILNLIILIYLILISGGPSACVRFRHPIMPILIFFAGYGSYSFFRWIRHKKCL